MRKSSLFGLITVLLLAACGNNPTPAALTTNMPLTKTRVVVVPTIEATSAPTPVEPTTVPSKPVGQPTDAKAAILAAIDALDKNGPYRMTITATSDAGGPVTLDVVPPDRSYYKGSLDGKPVEVIDIGNAAYVLNPDGTWHTSTSADSGTAGLLVDPASLNDLTNVEILPPQTIKGTPTTVYSFVDAASPEAVVTLWVSRDKGRPVQLQTTSPDETVLYMIEYDPSIKVEAPVK
jgi:hypothetical protein